MLLIVLKLHNDTKIAIRQYSNETHYFPFQAYYLCFTPKKAIRAAYKYADNVKKVRVVKHSDLDRYEFKWKCDEILRKQDWYSRRRRHKVGL